VSRVADALRAEYDVAPPPEVCDLPFVAVETVSRAGLGVFVLVLRAVEVDGEVVWSNLFFRSFTLGG